MKKTFKFAAIALVAISLMAACKNAPEATEDTTVMDTAMIEEAVEDTTVEDTVVVEEEAPVAKKATPKNNKKAITETKTEGGKIIAAPTTTEQSVKEEKAITNGEFKR